MTDSLPVEELEAMANIEIGEALRRTRLHYDQTLEDIERALRIRSCQIYAIEQGDIDKLPGRVYAIGFVRNYAEYLGLDGARAVQLFKAQYMDEQPSDILSFLVPASEAKTPANWLILLSIFASSLFFISWHKLNSSEYPSTFYIPKVSEEIKTHVAKEILVTSPVTENIIVTDILPDEIVIENMGEDKEQKTGVILNIIDNSWVEIKNSNGEIIVSDILEKGDEYFVPDSPGLSMSLGNAANVEIIIDGKALKPLGKDGDVRRDIPLNTSYLKTLEFKDAP